jgi:hypothetical protein
VAKRRREWGEEGTGRRAAWAERASDWEQEGRERAVCKERMEGAPMQRMGMGAPEGREERMEWRVGRRWVREQAV